MYSQEGLHCLGDIWFATSSACDPEQWSSVQNNTIIATPDKSLREPWRWMFGEEEQVRLPNDLHPTHSGNNFKQDWWLFTSTSGASKNDTLKIQQNKCVWQNINAPRKPLPISILSNTQMSHPPPTVRLLSSLATRHHISYTVGELLRLLLYWAEARRDISSLTYHFARFMMNKARPKKKIQTYLKNVTASSFHKCEGQVCAKVPAIQLVKKATLRATSLKSIASLHRWMS